MSGHDNIDDFDPDDCLCQMKVVPEDKRVDFQVVQQDQRTGKWKGKVVLRYHKDCHIHGIEVCDA